MNDINIIFSSRHPIYERFRHLRGGIYIVEGIIGVGKTTFGKSAEKYLNDIGLKCVFYPEYVNEDLLNQYISNMKHYAYFFQMLMLFKRIEIYNEAEKLAKTGGIALIDRSIVGDMSFAKMHVRNGNMSSDEWNIYLKVIAKELLPTPTACIYLRCTSKTSLDRIKDRGFASEINGYSSDYLNTLSNMYEETINESKNFTIINIDWNDSMKIKNGQLVENDIISILDKL